jgi:hypothetical protein
VSTVVLAGDLRPGDVLAHVSTVHKVEDRGDHVLVTTFDTCSGRLRRPVAHGLAVPLVVTARRPS